VYWNDGGGMGSRAVNPGQDEIAISDAELVLISTGFAVINIRANMSIILMWRNWVINKASGQKQSRKGTGGEQGCVRVKRLGIFFVSPRRLSV